jgi:hypothetical protein
MRSTHKNGPEDYRRLAQKCRERLTETCRETAHPVSTEKERADLLAMAKIWDFLADHGPHVRH